MPEWRAPRADEIDRKLRDDFRNRLKSGYGEVVQETDPVLAVLFRSMAAQIAEVYQQAAESMPLAVLDELVAGLGMPERRARPAQAVLRLSLQKGRMPLKEGTELIGLADSRERLTFALDSELEVSTAQVALAAVYQQGTLRLHAGVGLAKELEDARPSFEPVRADAGPTPSIFFAVEVGDQRHLSNHGFYFELSPEAKDLLSYLQRGTWCVLDDGGGARPEGLLRSRPGNAGVRRLEWLIPDSEAETGREAALPEGFYGGKVFVFPEVPQERAFLSRAPRKLEGPLRSLFQAGGEGLFERPRAWIQIPLPPEAGGVAEELFRIVPHCVTASNVEILNETIVFKDDGASFPVGNGGRRRHLVKPLSIKGEGGLEYLHESDPRAGGATGRYRFRRGRLEVEPARAPGGVADAYVNVSLILSDGESANRVGAGAVKTFLKKVEVKTLEVTSLTAAVVLTGGRKHDEGTEGTDGEKNGEARSRYGKKYDEARARFVEALLSRERIVTHSDLEAAVRAFEPRVRAVTCQTALERTHEGVRRVQRVTASVRRAEFIEPDEEARVLREELQAHLQGRALLGLDIRVAVEWT